MRWFRWFRPNGYGFARALQGGRTRVPDHVAAFAAARAFEADAMEERLLSRRGVDPTPGRGGGDNRLASAMAKAFGGNSRSRAEAYDDPYFNPNR